MNEPPQTEAELVLEAIERLATLNQQIEQHATALEELIQRLVALTYMRDSWQYVLDHSSEYTKGEN